MGLFGSGDKKKAESIKETVLEKFEKQGRGNRIDTFTVDFDDGTATLSGQCDSPKTKEKAILIVQGIEDVKQVNSDGLSAPQPEAPAAAPAAAPAQAPAAAPAQAPAAAPAAPQPEAASGGGGGRAVEPSPAPEQAAPQESEDQMYTIQSGDTLSKIAKEFFGDASKYMDIVKANPDVIKDPDKIYPGQEIRIPPAK